MQSLFKIAQAHGGHATGNRPDELVYSVVESGKSKAAIFVIGEAIRRRMHWIYGDRIDILFDPAMAEGQLIRVKDGGWKMCGRDEAKNAGPGRVRIVLRPEFNLPEVESQVALAVELTENTIVFAFPTKYRKQVKVS